MASHPDDAIAFNSQPEFAGISEETHGPVVGALVGRLGSLRSRLLELSYRSKNHARCIEELDREIADVKAAEAIVKSALGTVLELPELLVIPTTAMPSVDNWPCVMMPSVMTPMPVYQSTLDVTGEVHSVGMYGTYPVKDTEGE